MSGMNYRHYGAVFAWWISISIFRGGRVISGSLLYFLVGLLHLAGGLQAHGFISFL